MQVVPVKLKKSHIILRCATKEANLKPGDLVILETKDGSNQIGTVVAPPKEINPEIFPPPHCSVIRRATEEDHKKHAEEEKRAANAIRKCKDKVEELGLPMKMSGVDFSEEGKITFFFTAETRINFRELVKLLATEFHCRIEMRQIGARNEAKMIGGVGCCGLPLCCLTFLPDFESVTIKMAKEQGLSLDPAKISGLCGRLLCCLGYEAETYSEAIKELPKCGTRVTTLYGEGKVIKQNPLKKTLLIELTDGRQLTLKTEEIKVG